MTTEDVLNQSQPRYKHSRIGHLPFSKSKGKDDLDFAMANFVGQQVVVSEKMDGENTTIYSDGFCHARSIDSSYHPSRGKAKALAAAIAPYLPDNWRMCAENMGATHTIEYRKNIPTLLVHSLWKENTMLSYEHGADFVSQLDHLSIQMAPLLYKGTWDENAIRSSWKEKGAYGRSEGFVVRLSAEIEIADFPDSVAKYVSDSFQVGQVHWSKRF